jgi:hypothetical protein
MIPKTSPGITSKLTSRKAQTESVLFERRSKLAKGERKAFVNDSRKVAYPAGLVPI